MGVMATAAVVSILYMIEIMLYYVSHIYQPFYGKRAFATCQSFWYLLSKRMH